MKEKDISKGTKGPETEWYDNEDTSDLFVCPAPSGDFVRLQRDLPKA